MSHAALVCPFFSFMNRWVEGLGIPADPVVVWKAGEMLHKKSYAAVIELLDHAGGEACLLRKQTGQSPFPPKQLSVGVTHALLVHPRRIGSASACCQTAGLYSTRGCGGATPSFRSIQETLSQSAPSPSIRNVGVCIKKGRSLFG